MNWLPVVATRSDLSSRAQALEATFESPAPGFELQVTPEGLCLRSGDGRLKPLHVDFTDRALSRRLAAATPGTEALLQAVGLKGQSGLEVVDGTAGLGTDSFLLASAGCRVRLFERVPLLALLLQDGLARAAQDPRLASIVGRMTLVQADCRDWMARDDHDQTQVIYLDPMFPPRRGAAMPGREMQYLQAIVGTDDCRDLLECALNSGVSRVVLKRPRLAPRTDFAPSFTITRTACRFDVFMR